MADFLNKTTLITGGGRGLGRLMALRMAARGSHIILWDINEEGLGMVATEIAEKGNKVNTYFCDVSDRKMVYRSADKVREEVGKVDILINNAGVVSGRPFLECTDDQLRRTMEVNALSHFWTVRAFLPDMIRFNRGHIVTVSSVAGIACSAGLVDYCASKFAAFAFDETLRAELKKQRLNIHTTVVCTYLIKGKMFAGAKTRFPILLPILEAEYVAERIVHGIARKKRRIIIPSLLYSTWLLRLLPVDIYDWLVTFLGVNNIMDEYHGRQS